MTFFNHRSGLFLIYLILFVSLFNDQSRKYRHLVETPSLSQPHMQTENNLKRDVDDEQKSKQHQHGNTFIHWLEEASFFFLQRKAQNCAFGSHRRYSSSTVSFLSFFCFSCNRFYFFDSWDRWIYWYLIYVYVIIMWIISLKNDWGSYRWRVMWSKHTNLRIHFKGSFWVWRLLADCQCLAQKVPISLIQFLFYLITSGREVNQIILYWNKTCIYVTDLWSFVVVWC